MRNDTITFHFANESGEEVFLRPQALGEIGNALEMIFELLMTQALVPHEDYEVSVDIVALRPGCIDVSFLARIAGSILSEARKTPLSATANAFSVMKDLAAIYAFLCLASGSAVFAKQESKISKKVEFVEEFQQEALRDPRIRQHVRDIARYAMSAGADTVTLRIMDEPDLVITENGASNPKLIGSGATPLSKFGAFEGEIKVGVDQVNFIIDSDEGENPRAYRNGFMIHDGVEVAVLIDWGSQRPIPLPLDGTVLSLPVRVKGNLTPLSNLLNPLPGTRIKTRFVGDKEIPVSMRKATAILQVNFQIIEE